MSRLHPLGASLLFLFVYSSACLSQECVIPADPDEVVLYIQRAEDKHVSEACVRTAYANFSRLPVDKRVPLLLKLLATPIPPVPADQVPVSGGGWGTYFGFHPAVVSLIQLGVVAEPAVIDYIAADPDRSPFGWNSAIYVYFFEARPREYVERLIRILEEQRAGRTSADAARIDRAIRVIHDKYCPSDRSSDDCRAAASGS